MNPNTERYFVPMKILVPCLMLLVVLLASCGRDVLPTSQEAVTVNDVLMQEAQPYNEYIVNLEIDLYTRIVQGISRINFTNHSTMPLDTIVLRVYLNGLMEINYASIDDETVLHRLEGTYLTLYLEESLAPGMAAQLLLQYSSHIPEAMRDTGSNEFAMWFGRFLPVLQPSGEEPEPANYQVTITTPMRYTVAGTGLRTEEVIEDTDTRITHFTANMVKDFAFAVSPYFKNAHIATEGGIDIHLYYYTRGLSIDHILDIAKRSMDHFEAHVGVYPFGHVNIVEAGIESGVAAFSQMVFVDIGQFVYDNYHDFLFAVATAADF